ncbi:unnamed protein product, partial [marine sediment metagenome]
MSKSNTGSRKWKDRLLRSSIPLECECGNLLVKEGFIIDYGFCYTREISDRIKENSVDFK